MSAPPWLTQDDVAQGLAHGRFRLDDADHLTTPQGRYVWQARIGKWALVEEDPTTPRLPRARHARTEEERFRRTVERCARLWTFIGVILVLYWMWNLLYHLLFAP